MRERLVDGSAATHPGRGEPHPGGSRDTARIPPNGDRPVPPRAAVSAGGRDRRDDALVRGRETVALRRERQLSAVVAAAGLPGLADLLRSRYAAGASLDALARETGLGRERLRQEIRAAGIPVRSPGAVTRRGRASRARDNDAAAARRVGTSDLSAWLAARVEDGWSRREIASVVGHSTHWVRARLNAAPDRPRHTARSVVAGQ